MLLFTIIIPLYNKADYIENTIQSVLNQTYNNYEIIIINDGSNDESVAKVASINDNRILIYHQKNQGVSVARNYGIEKSKGSLIAFLDADDFWFPNHLEELANLYLRFPNCGMYCSRYKIKTAKNHFLVPHHNGIKNSYSGIVENYFFSNIPFRITWTSCLAIPKEILNNNGGFIPGVTNGQDLELWTKLGISHPVAITNKITAIYNFDIPNSLAKNNVNRMKLMDFDQFKIYEENNTDLKKFLDIYRMEYGLRYYTFGYKDEMNYYLKDVSPKNLNLKIRFLLMLPSFYLRLFLKFKHNLKKVGLNFTIYN
ncbi:glycosyltransferase family 2 protein [Flavobacterium algicola]|uniref:glycosyltransferase family 2 protein n=1 Tax=Flavobacterium algicola TaxID=556529 RepID=UPI001EFE6535|nr:glycosyltransferase family 2 protein [Flavobacterium algicola]MCG9793651.1 glycosyltransferase [Flavobacterium algicola]